jgi:hypothetical protein
MEFYELKRNIENKGGETHFFDHDTLKFFGERLSDMRLLKNTVEITDICGEKHICYIVSATRRKNAFGSCKPYTHYHYFDVNTFHHVIR